MFVDINKDIQLLHSHDQYSLDVAYSDDKQNFQLIPIDFFTRFLEFFYSSGHSERLKDYAQKAQKIFELQELDFENQQIDAFFVGGLSKWDFTLFDRASLSYNLRELLSENLGLPFKNEVSCSFDEECAMETARKEAELALKLGIKPKQNKGAQGSIIYLNCARKPIGIFKKEHASNSFSAKVRRIIQTFNGILRNQTQITRHEKTHAEIAASVAEKTFSMGGLVPLTRLVTIGGERGSLQLWSSGMVEAAQFHRDEEPTEEELDLFQLMVMYDFLFGNLDRHLENWLLELKGLKKLERIAMIDNGSILPEDHPTESLFDMFARKSMYQWKNHPWAKYPFSELIYEKMRQLTERKIEEYLDDIRSALPDRGKEFLTQKRISNLHLRANLLHEVGVNADQNFTPEELGQAFSEKKLKQLNKLFSTPGTPFSFTKTLRRIVELSLQDNPSSLRVVLDRLTTDYPDSAQKPILDVIFRSDFQIYLPEFLKGANICMKDEGTLYSDLLSISTATCEKQNQTYHSIYSPLFGDLVFWHDQWGNLRFQLEDFSLKPDESDSRVYFNFLPRLIQDGPYGFSIYAPWYPLIV
jgi:hypothetical protein